MVSAFKPSALGEALALLAENRGERRAVPLAGGTDLMVKRGRAPGDASGGEAAFSRPVVFVGHLRELDGVSVEDGFPNDGSGRRGGPRGARMLIGAACTFSSLLAHPAVPDPFKEIVSHIASPAVRNRGTVGGNVCNASPAGDTLPYLYALDAKAVLGRSGGTRELPVRELVTGPGETARADDELLLSLDVPLAPFNVFFYRKVGARRANSCSKLSFLGLARVEGGAVEDVRVCFGAVAPVVVRSLEIEESLRGLEVGELPERVPRVVRSYRELLRPVDDRRSAARYRMEVSLRLLERFLGYELRGGVEPPHGAFQGGRP
jgi:CO/xanthine dehydrogenase FAD-binding subunit